jgi:Flp pilus assembly pilin Flp
VIRRRPIPLARDERGATIVEFAIVAPVLCLTLLGFVELGYKSYVGSVVQGALHDAARSATVGDKTPAQIDDLVTTRLQAFSRGATITINKSSYTEFSDVKMPEKITQDTAPLGQYNSTDCYEDANGNGRYDTDRGKTGLGGSDDIVNYEIVMTFPPLVPLWKMIGGPTVETSRASTVLRNQPYAARTNNVVIRCT